MAHNSTVPLQDRSRIVKLFTELTDAKGRSYSYNLAERLGYFLGVHGAMTLAQGLKKLPLDQVNGLPVDIDKVERTFLNAHQRMIQNITDSFSGSDVDAQLKVPSTATGIRAEALRTFDPYQRFYTEHQIKLGVAVKGIREMIRRPMASLSPQLHRLAELDRLLENNLETHTSKQFGTAIKVLRQQFTACLARSSDVQHEEWIVPFHNVMQDFLLAELDTRLQPVLGLFEALKEHENNNE